MQQLTPALRRELKARAHALKPVVMIGNDGLTPPVLAEIDRALKSHELIKIRVLGDDRDARGAWLEQICSHTGAQPVQHIGKILVIHRSNPDEPKAAVRRPASSPANRKRTDSRRGEDRPFNHRAGRAPGFDNEWREQAKRPSTRSGGRPPARATRSTRDSRDRDGERDGKSERPAGRATSSYGAGGSPRPAGRSAYGVERSARPGGSPGRQASRPASSGGRATGARGLGPSGPSRRLGPRAAAGPRTGISRDAGSRSTGARASGARQGFGKARPKPGR